MAWETRPHGTYYYRSRRVGDRVVHEYRGNGEAAVLEAEEDEAARTERRAQLEAVRVHNATLRAVGERLDEHLSIAREAAARLLEAAGLHQHRGQWRRRR